MYFHLFLHCKRVCNTPTSFRKMKQLFHLFNLYLNCSSVLSPSLVHKLQQSPECWNSTFTVESERVTTIKKQSIQNNPVMSALDSKGVTHWRLCFIAVATALSVHFAKLLKKKKTDFGLLLNVWLFVVVVLFLVVLFYFILLMVLVIPKGQSLTVGNTISPDRLWFDFRLK